MSDDPQVACNPPERTYRLMDTNADADRAIDQVVTAVRRELRVFDASPRTLLERGFGRPARLVALRKLLLDNRGHRVRIVMHDTNAIETALPRLLDLLTRYSGQILINRTVGNAAEARDPMIIADDCHFWRKLHVDQRRSVVTLDDAVATRPVLERFEEIWEASEPAVSGKTLGL